MILNKIFNKIYEIFHPYRKLDEALRNSLEDSFKDSFFSLKEMIYTPNGFKLKLDYKKDFVPGEQKDYSKKSFLDYLPPEYESYKKIYLGLERSIESLGERINKRFEEVSNSLEKRLDKLQFSFGGLN
ncbi:hypothetical protein M0R72_04635 [Candidatus Pacearchaeota archaeon]|jgi:hypothetical protein|nr:hypothetical protein [Candidatus Pacearchaeota archaeon]